MFTIAIMEQFKTAIQYLLPNNNTKVHWKVQFYIEVFEIIPDAKFSLDKPWKCFTFQKIWGTSDFKSKSQKKNYVLSCSLFQTSANQGPNMRFILGAIIKALISKLSQSSIMITLNCVHLNHDFQPNSNLSDYLNFHTYSCEHLFLTAIRLGI